MEADTTMTLQGGVRQSAFGSCSFDLASTLPSLSAVRAEIELKNYILIIYMKFGQGRKNSRSDSLGEVNFAIGFASVKWKFGGLVGK